MGSATTPEGVQVRRSRSVGVSSQTRAHVEAAVAAAHGREPAGVRAALHSAAEGRGLGRCVDEVLMPALRRVGCWPEQPDETESAVGLAVETMRAWLDALSIAAPAPLDRPPLIMACAPGDRHSLGLEALTVLLRHQRQPCRLLSSRASADAIVIAVRVNRPSAVVVSAQLESRLPESGNLLRSIAQSGVLTFYAGAAYDSAAARRDVPGRYLGRNFSQACELVLQALPDSTGPDRGYDPA
jgi:MerR family transcriptional regulator, light-induced transcriptional regulator